MEQDKDLLKLVQQDSKLSNSGNLNDDFDDLQPNLYRIDSGIPPQNLQLQKFDSSDSQQDQLDQIIQLNYNQNKLVIPKRQELLDNEDILNVDAEVQQQINEEIEEEKQGENSITIDLDIMPKFKFLDSSIKAKQNIPVMIKLTSQMKELKKEGSKSSAMRIPIDLAIIIDVSGSMQGQKLKLVQESLKYLLTILTENDRICLIQFDSRADILTSFRKCTPQFKVEMTTIIDALRSKGSTNIEAGFESALFMLKSRKYINKVTGVFLLSDGQDDNQNVAERVHNCVLKSEIKSNFKINTFGYGNDHDAKAMTQMASQSQGNYYFIESLEKVNHYFVLSLSGLLTIVAENVEINLSLEDKIDVTKTFGGEQLWKYSQIQNTHSITEKMLLGGVEKHYVFEIEVPELTEQSIMNQSIPILKVNFKYQTVKNKIVKEQNKNLSIKVVSEKFPADDSDLQAYENQEVSIEHFRVLTAEKIKEAQILAQQNQHEKAQELLEQMIMAMKFSKYNKEKIIETLIKDCERIKNVCQPKIFQEYGEAFMLKKYEEHNLELALSCEMNYANDYQQDLMDCL